MGKLIFTTLLAILLLAPQAGLLAGGNQQFLSGKPFSDLDERISALEESDSPASDLIFSGNFIEGNATNFDLKVAWANFKNSATGSFSSIEIRNVLIVDGVEIIGSIICSETAIATDIVRELNTHVPIAAIPSPGSLKSFTCLEPATSDSPGRAVTWNVGECVGEVELNATLLGVKNVCQTTETSEAAIIRPHALSNWGGVGTDFGGAGGTTGRKAPSQTLQIILTR